MKPNNSSKNSNRNIHLISSGTVSRISLNVKTSFLLLFLLAVLLSAARNARDTKLAQNTFDRMQKLFPRHQHDLMIGSILLANTDGFSSIRTGPSPNTSKRQVGVAWTFINGTLIVFNQFQFEEFCTQTTTSSHV